MFKVGDIIRNMVAERNDLLNDLIIRIDDNHGVEHWYGCIGADGTHCEIPMWAEDDYSVVGHLDLSELFASIQEGRKANFAEEIKSAGGEVGVQLLNEPSTKTYWFKCDADLHRQIAQTVGDSVYLLVSTSRGLKIGKLKEFSTVKEDATKNALAVIPKKAVNKWNFNSDIEDLKSINEEIDNAVSELWNELPPWGSGFADPAKLREILDKTKLSHKVQKAVELKHKIERECTDV